MIVPVCGWNFHLACPDHIFNLVNEPFLLLPSIQNTELRSVQITASLDVSESVKNDLNWWTARCVVRIPGLPLQENELTPYLSTTQPKIKILPDIIQVMGLCCGAVVGTVGVRTVC